MKTSRPLSANPLRFSDLTARRPSRKSEMEKESSLPHQSAFWNVRHRLFHFIHLLIITNIGSINSRGGGRMVCFPLDACTSSGASALKCSQSSSHTTRNDFASREACFSPKLRNVHQSRVVCLGCAPCYIGKGQLAS